MTTYLGKSCSFCLPRVPFVNCRQFMYLVISLLVLRAGYGVLIVSVPDHCLSFYFVIYSKWNYVTHTSEHIKHFLFNFARIFNLYHVLL